MQKRIVEKSGLELSVLDLGYFTPTYFFNKNFGLGVYYLGSHGLDENITQYTHFVALKSILSNIKISN
jgi:hypothetical protein